MKLLWPSPSNYITLAKLDKLRREFDVSDDWIIEVDEQGFHLQHPDVARREMEPIIDPAERCECLCHRGKQCDHPYSSKEPKCPHCGRSAPV